MFFLLEKSVVLACRGLRLGIFALVAHWPELGR